MTDRARICTTADLGPGERTTTTVNGVPLGVFNVDGEYYAIANRCAHEGGPVCTGQTQPVIDVEFSDLDDSVREYYTDRMAIACPWHGWEYDLETGDHLGDDEISIPTYEVVVDDDVIYVEV